VIEQLMDGNDSLHTPLNVLRSRGNDPFAEPASRTSYILQSTLRRMDCDAARAGCTSPTDGLVTLQRVGDRLVHPHLAALRPGPVGGLSIQAPA
jgi:hypothetical protein